MPSGFSDYSECGFYAAEATLRSVGRTVALASWAAAYAATVGARAGPDRGESAIQADRHAAGRVLLVGSSGIRRWGLEGAFPGRGFVNRGFGGVRTAGSRRDLDRIVLPRKPRRVVIYAGGGDLAAGESPADVGSELQALAGRVRAVLPPPTKIVAVGLPPSIRRGAQLEAVRAAPARGRAVAAGNQHFVSGGIEGPLLGAVGHPWAEPFAEHGLPCRAAGYAIWAERRAAPLD